MPKPSRLARAVVMVSFLCLPAWGQTPAAGWARVKMIAVGTKIRVTAGNSKAVSGSLRSITDSDLAIQSETGPRSFARADIRGLSARQKNRRLRKVLIGVGIGTAAGIAIGGAAANNCMGIGCGGSRVALGGLVGLAGGVIAGLLWSRSEWREIYVP
jgi:hypothetical protein